MTNQCDNCKFCVYRDFGSSNWTVEGTDQFCGEGVHDGFDRFYGQAPEIKSIPFPCSKFEPGKPIRLDVDMEVFDSLTDEEKQIAGLV